MNKLAKISPKLDSTQCLFAQVGFLNTFVNLCQQVVNM